MTPDSPDTLPRWLHRRFGKGAWDELSQDDQAYWEHEAAAVRRAVERGGFKNVASPPRYVSDEERVREYYRQPLELLDLAWDRLHDEDVSEARADALLQTSPFKTVIEILAGRVDPADISHVIDVAITAYREHLRGALKPLYADIARAAATSTQLSPPVGDLDKIAAIQADLTVAIGRVLEIDPEVTLRSTTEGTVRWIFETTDAEVTYEDGGQAAIVEIHTGVESDPHFVRVQSWSESREHPMIERLVGRRVRVTVELVEEG